MIDALTIILIVFSFLYFFLIVIFTWGWNRKPEKNDLSCNEKKTVSVIIAVRNEEKNLPELLHNISSQNYHQELIEVIICDDASEDNSVSVTENFSLTNKNIRIITTAKGASIGKKGALKGGFKEAKGEILITTDADCNLNPNWIRSIVNGFNSSYQPKFIIGPVLIDYKDNSIFSRFQALEFISLQGSTGGASNIGFPIMCNGANLAITRETWLQAENTLKGSRYKSGDDIFLLQAIKKICPDKILFLKNQESVVTTKPSEKLTEFLSQRMRWAGKSLGYSDFFSLFTGALIGGYNLTLLVWIIKHFVSAQPMTALAFVGIKMIIDFPLMLQTSIFFKSRRLMSLYPLLSLIYPFYVSITLFSSIFIPNKWKKRAI